MSTTFNISTEFLSRQLSKLDISDTGIVVEYKSINNLDNSNYNYNSETFNIPEFDNLSLSDNNSLNNYNSNKYNSNNYSSGKTNQQNNLFDIEDKLNKLNVNTVVNDYNTNNHNILDSTYTYNYDQQYNYNNPEIIELKKSLNGLNNFINTMKQ
jgi:hypothetical protein